MIARLSGASFQLSKKNTNMRVLHCGMTHRQKKKSSEAGQLTFKCTSELARQPL